MTKTILMFCSVFMFATSGMARQPVSARDQAETSAAPSDQVVCKRFVRTGSLVDSYRTCKTKWEWERERDNLRVLNVSDSCRSRAEPNGAIAGGGC